MSDPYTAPDDDDPVMSLRLMFERHDTGARDEWIAHLTRHRIDIAAASETALTVSGRVTELQNVLLIDIQTTGERTVITEKGDSTAPQPSRRPSIYAPRKPTLF